MAKDSQLKRNPGDTGAKGDKGDPGDGGSVPAATDATGGSGDHNNTQPNVAVNCIIALQGTLPQRTGTPATTSFLGEISWFAGNFAPTGWAFCDGQLLSINGNEGLFSLLGTTYGGDGRTTFGLPDARGRSLVHAGAGIGLSTRRLGANYGTETETPTVGEMPSHTHGIS